MPFKNWKEATNLWNFVRKGYPWDIRCEVIVQVYLHFQRVHY